MVQVEENLQKLCIRSILSHCKRTRTPFTAYMKQHVDSAEADETRRLFDEVISEFAGIFESDCQVNVEVSDSCISYVAGACAKKVLYRWCRGCDSCQSILVSAVGEVIIINYTYFRKKFMAY